MIRHRNRLTGPMTASPTKAGWRVNEWAADCGVSRAYVYNLLSSKPPAIDSVKVGSARVITTAPRDFLAALAGEAA
jgi:hypothetical protein